MAGRIALVTGASRGIGRGVAIRYAAEGAHLVLVARTQEGLEPVNDEIRKVGGTATLLPLDMTDFDAVDSIRTALIEHFGCLDVLVANAAILGRLGQKPISIQRHGTEQLQSTLPPTGD